MRFVQVRFGKFHDLVAPVARYWFPATKDATKQIGGQVSGKQSLEKTNAWVHLTYAEFKERKLGREPHRGTLELLGQSGQLIWSKDAHSSQSHSDVICRFHPSFMQVPGFSVDGMK